MTGYGRAIDGWILDVSTSGSGVVLWIKTAGGLALPVDVPYKPTMYLVPRNEPGILAGVAGFSPFNIVESLGQLDDVAEAKIVQRRVQLHDLHESPAIQVKATDPAAYRRLVTRLGSGGIFDLYNVDIPVFQKYLYESGLFPMARATFHVKKRGKRLVLAGVDLNDDRRALRYDLPPLRVAWLEVESKSTSGITRGRRDFPVDRVALRPALPGGVPHEPFEPFELSRGGGSRVDEEMLLRGLVNAVQDIDPDIVLTRGGDEIVFPYLCARASITGLKRHLRFSRTNRPLESECFRLDGGENGDGSFFSYGQVLRRSQTQFYLSGRLHLDTEVHGSLHFRDGNIPGMIEVARVSSVPLQRLNRITIGGALQSIQFMLAHERGILIPHVKRSAETFKTANDLLLADRGGHVFEPTTGLFDHVVSLDFTSMYPMIMSRYNVSPETVNCPCCAPAMLDDGTGTGGAAGAGGFKDGQGVKGIKGVQGTMDMVGAGGWSMDGTLVGPGRNLVPGLGYHVCYRRRGLIPDAITIPLEKRVRYKQLARELGGSAGAHFDQVQAALKWILVVSFGYLGFKNARFGRVEAHQAVCAYAREMLLRSASIARSQGFRVIHGIVDSLWCQRTGQRDDVDGRIGGSDLEADAARLCDAIERETGLPMESDGIFRFVVFLPSVVNPNVGTLNRYWGVFTDGRVKVRGIELRRHDAPPVVKAMQRDVIDVLAPARDAAGFMNRLPEARRVLRCYLDDLESGKLDPKQLVITNRVSRRPGEYRVNSHQAIAAKQLERAGKKVLPGQSITYVITNARSKLPGNRVVAWDLFGQTGGRPDLEAYRALLERAFDNLFPFKARPGDDVRGSRRFSGETTRGIGSRDPGGSTGHYRLLDRWLRA